MGQYFPWEKEDEICVLPLPLLPFLFSTQVPVFVIFAEM